jgi:hypothetical protein
MEADLLFVIVFGFSLVGANMAMNIYSIVGMEKLKNLLKFRFRESPKIESYPSIHSEKTEIIVEEQCSDKEEGVNSVDEEKSVELEMGLINEDEEKKVDEEKRVESGMFSGWFGS